MPFSHRLSPCLLQPSTQSVDDLKKVVAEGRKRPGAAAGRVPKADFNEEDYMDGDLMDDELHMMHNGAAAAAAPARR